MIHGVEEIGTELCTQYFVWEHSMPHYSERSPQKIMRVAGTNLTRVGVVFQFPAKKVKRREELHSKRLIIPFLQLDWKSKQLEMDLSYNVVAASEFDYSDELSRAQ